MSGIYAYTFPWGKQSEADLRRLWAEGHSASIIADELARTYRASLTRSSVLGKVHRLKLPQRMMRVTPEHGQRKPHSGGSTGPRKPRAFTAKRNPEARQPAARPSKPKVGFNRLDANEKPTAPVLVQAAPQEPLRPPIMLRVPLLGLTDRVCHFPIGDPKSPDFGFCGVKGGHKGKPLCAFHYSVCYVPAADRKKKLKEMDEATSFRGPDREARAA